MVILVKMYDETKFLVGMCRYVDLCKHAPSMQENRLFDFRWGLNKSDQTYAWPVYNA